MTRDPRMFTERPPAGPGPTTMDHAEFRALRARRGRRSLDLPGSQAVRLALMWIRDATPAALIRFGEGEGRLLVADADNLDSARVAAKKLRRQTGQMLSVEDVLRIKSLVVHAFDEADVVGIKGSASFSDEHKVWVRRIEAFFKGRLEAGRSPAFVTHCLVNNDLRDALPLLLQNQGSVSLICCRDLGGLFETAFGIDDVAVYQVPSQFAMRDIDGAYEERLHGVPFWPDFFEGLQASIRVRKPGEVFLIGAGLLGKSLCLTVKERGGIALDLGSCLDGLAGQVTRGPGRPAPYVRPPSP